jgi:nicotinamide mononucleotide transporter
LSLVCTGVIAHFLSRHTDSPAPAADASILTLSLAATYGQAQKLLESWWVWIVVDVVSVPLYVSRALYPTALLYAVFGGLCVKGLMEWTFTLDEKGTHLA